MNQEGACASVRRKKVIITSLTGGFRRKRARDGMMLGDNDNVQPQPMS